MKLVSLLFLSVPSLASILAGPYQTVLFWYAYRLEVEQYGPTGTWTGLGCIGSVPEDGCYVCLLSVPREYPLFPKDGPSCREFLIS
jgi:hypothetical protein